MCQQVRNLKCCSHLGHAGLRSACVVVRHGVLMKALSSI